MFDNVTYTRDIATTSRRCYVTRRQAFFFAMMPAPLSYAAACHDTVIVMFVAMP